MSWKQFKELHPEATYEDYLEWMDDFEGCLAEECNA